MKPIRRRWPKNAQFRHPFAEHWGDGTTSSSDGQNFRTGSKAHRAHQAIQEQIRERIVATNDMRLFAPAAPAGSGVAAHGASAVAGGLRADDARG
jgi:hypothetical protein